MSFENKVQQWVQLDNQLKKLNEQVKQLRDQRNSLETNLTSYAKTNNMSDSTIKVNNDRLKFVDTKVPEPLTFKYLEKSLSEIIKNENQVQLIIEHIKQKRNVKIVSEIKRFSNN
jgi:predicted  nucleic acid-binding Zn-ribbon protein